MIGRTLGGYRVIEQIGLGGMATVYKAYDPGTDRFVALKVLPEHYSKDPTFRERFQREAKAIAKLEHPRILPIFAYGEEDGAAYLVMRYMESGTLAEAMSQGRLALSAASQIVTQVADALDYAHEHGIIHRDVKPSNVLLDKNGNTYLTDFGIAKMVEGASDLTGSGLIGTPHYMSPEQCTGRKDLTPASDQYSLGIILYEMVTGQKPFQAETPVAVVMKHLHDPLPSPRSFRPDLPDAMERPLYKALAKEPHQRFESCRALASAFARALASAQVVDDQTVKMPAGDEGATLAIGGAQAGETTSAAAPPPSARRRIPAWAALAGLAVIVVLAGAAILGGLFRPKTPPPPAIPATDQAGPPGPIVGPPERSVVVRVAKTCPLPTITARDNVFVRVGWVSGSADEVDNAARHLKFVVTLDGKELPVAPPARSPIQGGGTDLYGCGAPGGTGFAEYFDFALGKLAAGPHTIAVEFILDATVTDVGTPVGPGSVGKLERSFEVAPAGG